MDGHTFTGILLQLPAIFGHMTPEVGGFLVSNGAINLSGAMPHTLIFCLSQQVS